MSKNLISRRAAVRAGKKLNEMVERLSGRTPDGMRTCRLMPEREVDELAEAVRIANEVIYQYNAIPKDVREFWWTGYKEAGEDGVPVCDTPEE